jgi:hypothetical protein
LEPPGYGESSVEQCFSDDLKPDGREHDWITVYGYGYHLRHHRMNNKLFVGNLSFNVTENELQDTFAQYGTVLEANLMTDRMTGRPRGFGFVTMSTEEEAQKAVEALNGSQLDNRALTVNVARPREERSGGGGGGGGYRGGGERRGGGGGGGGYGGGGGGRGGGGGGRGGRGGGGGDRY